MIYNFVIGLYISAVHLAALFNKKVAKMVKGEKESFTVLKQHIDPQAKYLWFHAASLGEFEQGRPLIERIRQQYPQYKILQTFSLLRGTRFVRIIRVRMWYATYRSTLHAT